MKVAYLIDKEALGGGCEYIARKMARALGCRILATDCPGNRDVLAGYEKWEVLKL